VARIGIAIRVFKLVEWKHVSSFPKAGEEPQAPLLRRALNVDVLVRFDRAQLRFYSTIPKKVLNQTDDSFVIRICYMQVTP